MCSAIVVFFLKNRIDVMLCVKIHKKKKKVFTKLINFSRFFDDIEIRR